ncbi:MAG: hypothetical protein H0X24_06525 [Ktedonobacterales bacterium]|nr:hypothetical protein [Ktedonobacterales bacterium]
MKCDEVRVLLAAYRRSEWSDEEQHMVNAHLVGCAECRRWESQARGVGEHLRQMPTIVPPPSLRANVFAIIRQEELARATQAAETAKAATPAPERLPVPPRPVILTRPMNLPARPTTVTAVPPARIGELAIGKTHPPRILFGRTTAIATIAAVFVLIFAAQLTPLFNVHVVNPGSPAGIVQHPLKPAVFTPAPDAAYTKISSPFADLIQLFFVGQTAAGQRMLFSQDRTANAAKPLLAQSTASTITIYGVSDGLLLWQETNGNSWAIKGIALSDGAAPAGASTPMILAMSGQSFGNSTLAKLTAYWLDGQSLLFAALDTHGATILVRADVAGGAVTTTFITEALAGHYISSPYLDGKNAYWVDRVSASDGTQQGTLWSYAETKGLQSLGVTGSAFGPVASGDRLAWFAPDVTTNPSSASAESGLTAAFTGSIVTRDSATGQPKTLSSGPILLTNVVRGAGYLLWTDAQGALHSYVLDSGEKDKTLPITVTLSSLNLSFSSATWSSALTQGVTTTTTISVVDVKD